MFKVLRVLSLCDCCIFELPLSVRDLKLMKYLNLSRTEIREISETVCNLYYLQTLLLSDCRMLRKLPTNMGKLINLHHLDVTPTDLEEMLVRMGNLKDLQTLIDFVAGSSMKDLESLKNLSESLFISRLESVVYVEKKVWWIRFILLTQGYLGPRILMVVVNRYLMGCNLTQKSIFLELWVWKSRVSRMSWSLLILFVRRSKTNKLQAMYNIATTCVASISQNLMIEGFEKLEKISNDLQQEMFKDR